MKKKDEMVQMTMFEVKDDKLRTELRALDIEHMTPLEAMQTTGGIEKKG